MSELCFEQGVVFGIGGTNARVGTSLEGNMEGFRIEATPDQPDEFFRWMARQTLEAADSGAQWAVAGFPGPVSRDGSMIGPMVNVPGLSKTALNMQTKLGLAEPAFERLIGDGFDVFAVNDGELAAQAAAHHTDTLIHNTVAALIIGTGVGAGIVNRDQANPNVYRADQTPSEIGHIPRSTDPSDTFENSISGTALEKAYGVSTKELPSNHPAWKRVGETAAQLCMLLGLTHGVERIVLCGGVGSGAADYYLKQTLDIIDSYGEFGNSTQNVFLPLVTAVPRTETDSFELHGGYGVVSDFTTRPAHQTAQAH
jgi:predicted NBD/HSP70 family sugar kinase